MGSVETMKPDDAEAWRKNTTLEERVQHLYTTSQFSDMEFYVTDDDGPHIFKVHSTILCIASPVFERMFFNEHFDRSKQIEIVDIESEYFDLFLKYLYKVKFDFTSVEQAWSLYYLAEKYIVPELKDLCLSFILKSIKPETACTTYEMANKFHLYDLAENCFEFIVKRTDKVVNDPSFLTVNRDTIFRILSQRTLNIREVDLLVGVINWAMHYKSVQDNQEDNKGTLEKISLKNIRCNLIKKILSHIYFMDISADEFACKVSAIDILTTDESLKIIMKLVSKEVKAWPKGFKKCKRVNKDIHDDNDDGDISKVVFDGEGSESVTQEKWCTSVLKVSFPVIIIGFEISCCENESDPTGSYEEKSQVVILNSETGESVSVDVQQSVVYGSKLRVDFVCPFPAYSDSSYQICILTDDSSLPRQTVKLDNCIFKEEDVEFSIFASTSPSNTPLTGIYFVATYDIVD